MRAGFRRFEMDAAMRLGAPSLKVRRLEESLEFYQGKLGMRNVGDGRKEGRRVVSLGVGEPYAEPLLTLDHHPGATSPAPRSAGLFHFAVLVPDRKSLASTLLAVGNAGVGFEGFADHLVSESLYLRDIEGNGIEIYHDKPRSEWPLDKDGHVLMDTLPLSLDSVLHELSTDEMKGAKPFPRGARIGHMHLKVSNLDRAVSFYRDSLGLNLMLSWNGASFLSAGGYHHHVAVNTWQSLGGPRRREQDAGLEEFTIQVPRDTLGELASGTHSAASESDGGRVRAADPDGNAVTIEAIS